MPDLRYARKAESGLGTFEVDTTVQAHLHALAVAELALIARDPVRRLCQRTEGPHRIIAVTAYEPHCIIAATASSRIIAATASGTSCIIAATGSRRS